MRQLFVHEGLPSHEDHDEISSDRFSQKLQLKDHILFVPVVHEHPLHRAVGVGAVPYISDVRDLIASAWGELLEEEDYETVARVDSDEVVRPVLVFERAKSS